MASKATLALKAGLWFRRGRLVMVSPVHGKLRRGQAEIPLIKPVQFSRATSRYPGSVNDQLNVAERIWARELTDDERARAESMLDSFVRATNGSRRRSPLQEYLSERKFDLLAAEDTAPTSRQAEPAGDHPQFVSIDDPLWPPVAAAWRRESDKNVDPPIWLSETKNQKGWWFPKRLVAKASAAPT
jgi:hypothetical protein